MRLTLLLLGSIVIVAGCASRQVNWVKDGGSQQEFRKDIYECERDMRQSGNFGSGLMAQARADEFMKSCMRARGYSEH